jgi:uncharacterized protein (UPF0216 family)
MTLVAGRSECRMLGRVFEYDKIAPCNTKLYINDYYVRMVRNSHLLHTFKIILMSIQS